MDDLHVTRVFRVQCYIRGKGGSEQISQFANQNYRFAIQK